MANLVLPVAGAVVGAIFGGPTGAQIGWMAGSMIQTSRTEIDQRKVGDLRVQTSSYGVAIPYVIGKQRLSGNIIWADEKKTYDIKQRQGKGGPKVVTTGYTISMLIGICAGPILGVSRVWANGELIVDARTVTPIAATDLVEGSTYQIVTVGTTDFTAIGAASNTVGTAFVCTGAGTGTGTAAKPKNLIGQLYLGDDTQLPDPTYQSIVGAANAPAYRGLAYMALTNFDLGASGAIPQFSFEVVRGSTL